MYVVDNSSLSFILGFRLVNVIRLNLLNCNTLSTVWLRNLFWYLDKLYTVLSSMLLQHLFFQLNKYN